MKRLRIPNPDLSKSQKTYLDADLAAAGTALTVVSNIAFAADDIAVIGEPGEEKTEGRALASVAGNTTITATTGYRFSHNKGEVIYRFEYDAVEISGHSGNGTWAVLSNLSTLQWDQADTLYIHPAGTDAWSYRWRFYNTQTSNTNKQYSSYSPTYVATGFADNTVGFAIREIRKILGDEERRLISDEEFLRQFNRLKDHIQNMRSDWWFLLVDTYQGSDGITTVAATDVYALSSYSNLNFISTVRFNYNDGTDDLTYHLEQVSKLNLEYDKRDEDADDDDHVEKYTFLPPNSTSPQGYLRVHPTPETTAYGTFYPDYYKKMADVDDLTDDLEVPLMQVFIDYGLGYGFRVKKDEVRAKLYGDIKQGAVKEDLDNLVKLDDSRKKAVGQPKSLKSFKGRRPINRYFKDRAVNRDDLAERYF